MDRYQFACKDAVPATSRLDEYGPVSLTTPELLALATGMGQREADRLWRRGKDHVKGLTGKTLQLVRGVGPANARRYLAAAELVERLRDKPDPGVTRVSGPKDAYGQLRHIATLNREHLVGLYLDAQNALVCRETLSIGTLNTTRTHPREVLAPAIRHHALGFILGHNHPSGNLTPSQDDVGFTRGMRKAAEVMGLDLYDHLIVARGGFVSLREKGLL